MGVQAACQATMGGVLAQPPVDISPISGKVPIQDLYIIFPCADFLFRRLDFLVQARRNAAYVQA